MLYRHKDFGETLVHQCADADKYTIEHKQEMANVRVHDVAAYISLPVRDYNKEGYPLIKHETAAIKCCPYCGIVLDTDQRTNEFLDLKLL